MTKTDHPKNKDGYRTGLTNYERESFYHFNEEEKSATLSTHNKALIRHMTQKLQLKPDSINEWGEYVFTFPKKWLRKPQKPRPVSDNERKRMAKQFKKNMNK